MWDIFIPIEAETALPETVKKANAKTGPLHSSALEHVHQF